MNGDDRALAVKARQAGLSVQALSDWRMQSRGEGAAGELYQSDIDGDGNGGGASTQRSAVFG